MTSIDQPQKILLIRLSAIGDIVMASPLIHALRRRYPQAHLAWLVQAEAQDLLNANPALDEVIVWPRSEWKKMWQQRQWARLWSALRQFSLQLRMRRFDLVIDLQGLLKSGVWARVSGASRRIGLGSREGSAHLMHQIITPPADDLRIGSEYRYLAQTLGLPSDDFFMDVALSEEDHRFAENQLDAYQLYDGYAVICPFTTRPQKHWVEQRWIELAQQLRNRLGMKVVVLGGPGDSVAAERICAGQDPLMINVVGKTTLRQAAALISRAKLLVGVDTGLTHMGIAFNIPTVTLFGSTCPYTDTGRDNTVVIYKQLPCAPCRRNPTCGGAYTCMSSITVEEIVAHASRLLSEAC